MQGVGLELQVQDLGQAVLKPYDSTYYGNPSQISYHTIIPAVFAFLLNTVRWQWWWRLIDGVDA